MSADLPGRLVSILVTVVLTGIVGFAVQLRLAAEKRRVDREERHAKHLEDAVADLLERTQEAMDAQFSGSEHEQTSSFHRAERRLAAAVSTTQAWAVRADELGFAQALWHFLHPLRSARQSHLEPRRYDDQLTWFTALQLLTEVCSNWVRDPDAYELEGRGLSRQARKTNGFTAYSAVEKPYLEREQEEELRTQRRAEAWRAEAAVEPPAPTDGTEPA